MPSTPSNLLAGPSARALVRHRQPGPRPVLPGPGRHPALADAGAARPPRSDGRSGSCSAPRPLLLGGRLGRLVTALVNVSVAFPGLLLVLVLRGHLRRRREGRGAGDRPRGRPELRPPLPDARRRRRRARLRRRGAHRAASAGSGSWPGTCCPTSAEPLIVNATISAGAILLAFAGLSFLGLGVQPPEYDWGRLMQDGLSGIYVNPLAALAPGHRGGPRRARLQPHRRGDRRGASGSPRRRAPARCRCRPARRPATDASTTTTRPTATWCSTSATSRSPSRARTARSGRCAASPSRIAAARPSASWASPGPASRSPRSRSPGWSRSRDASTPGRLDASRRPTCSSTGDRSDQRKLLGTSLADGVPGPDDLVQPDDADRRPARRGRAVTTRDSTARRRWPAPSTGCGAVRDHATPSAGPASTRTSSPAACASAP